MPITRWMIRRQLDTLNQELDAALDAMGSVHVDFFRSAKVKKYLSNTAYAKLLTRKAQRIREAAAETS